MSLVPSESSESQLFKIAYFTAVATTYRSPQLYEWTTMLRPFFFRRFARFSDSALAAPTFCRNFHEARSSAASPHPNAIWLTSRRVSTLPPKVNLHTTSCSVFIAHLQRKLRRIENSPVDFDMNLDNLKVRTYMIWIVHAFSTIYVKFESPRVVFLCGESFL